MKTILVPLDLSAASVRVCRSACDLAQLTGGRLLLLHVVAPPHVMLDGAQTSDITQLTKLFSTAGKIATRRLRALDRFCARRKVGATTAQRVGTPVGAILAKAASAHAAYIVMGSQGHGAIYDLLVGGTASGVRKGASCPVLIVPARPNG